MSRLSFSSQLHHSGSVGLGASGEVEEVEVPMTTTDGNTRGSDNHNSLYQSHMEEDRYIHYTEDDVEDDGDAERMSDVAPPPRVVLSSHSSNGSGRRPQPLAATLRQPRDSFHDEPTATAAVAQPSTSSQSHPAISILRVFPAQPTRFPPPQNDRHRLVVKSVPAYIQSRPKQHTYTQPSSSGALPRQSGGATPPHISPAYQHRAPGTASPTHTDGERKEKAAACC